MNEKLFAFLKQLRINPYIVKKIKRRGLRVKARYFYEVVGERSAYETDRIIQCAVYLAQKKGFNMGYNFLLTVKGVYSPRLAKDLIEIENEIVRSVGKREASA